MEAAFHAANRRLLADFLPDDAVALSFAGTAPRLSADAYYPFFANRNFLYLTGVSFAGYILLLHKTGGEVSERLYILPKDAHAERWSGRRFSPEQVTALSGVADVRLLDAFESDIFSLLSGGSHTSLWLDLYKNRPDEPSDAAHRFAQTANDRYPWLRIGNLLPQLRRQRTRKAPCEIAAMQRAMQATHAGILAMMRASRPGMYEYEYKAAFDHALTGQGVLTPGFQPIISAGTNNFCIHYDAYTGRAEDGDMILNDVGASWDGVCNDVSRGWPCNGRFNREQRALYECALRTSDYLFSVIKPGTPMHEVDATIRRFCCGELKKLGLVKSNDEIGRYMWHGGAHHVGYDVHDVVDTAIGSIAPGMVFCVDVGIYVEDWGIGFRLEDNCLVTGDGCVNLSADIPRTVEEIESAMRG